MVNMAQRGIGAGISQQVGPAGSGLQSGHGAPSGAEGPAGGHEAASPEEQAQYDKFVNNALEIIYPAGERGQMAKAVQQHLSGQFEPELAKMFQPVDPPINPQAPIDCIAATSVLITAMLEGSAQQAGKPLSDEVIYNGGSEVVEILANDGEAAGLFDVSEQDVENAFYRAVDMYRQISPRVDQQQLSGEFGEIAQADANGQLDRMLPGIGQAMQRKAAA